MRNLLSEIRIALRVAVLTISAVGLAACSSGSSGSASQWGDGSSIQAQVGKTGFSHAPDYTYDGTLVGTVKDDEGYPLEKVSVVAKIPGDSHVFASSTDRYGKFELKYPKKLVREIEFSMLGKESVSVPTGKRKKIDVVLQDAAIELDPGLLERPSGAFGIVQPGD